METASPGSPEGPTWTNSPVMESGSQSGLYPVRQIAAHELVLEQIRRSIQLGQFRPGDRLPTARQLAEILSVSRTTIRAAITDLERDGLLSVKRGRGGGFFVQSPKLDPEDTRREIRNNRLDIGETFEYREIVESAAARLAASRRSGSDIEHLRDLSVRMGIASKLGREGSTVENVVEFQTLDTEFHVRIARASQNRHLIDAVIQTRRQMWLPVGAIFGRLESNANDHHSEICDAIEHQQPDVAASLMSRHVIATRSTIEAWSSD